ncbi:MAG: phenolic acid decarboxylase [Anaeromyxobacteraceae bacterium]|jgi:4-hydroxy-3-polyprenylbenzoate decarboxylase|nr:phenolic acid decarboxylase [Anaeromyxobacteraceae bacterium]
MGVELALVVTGACGTRLAVRFAELAASHPQVETLHVVLSDGARFVVADELGADRATPAGFVAGLALKPAARRKVKTWAEADMNAPIASGSHRLAGVVVLPCSAATACSLAAGVSRGLGQRVGDVALKQRWPLLLGFRETPLSAIHLQALLTLTQAGGVVVPPIPAYYLGGDEMPRFVDHYCVRLFDLLGLPVDRADLRWRGEEA